MPVNLQAPARGPGDCQHWAAQLAKAASGPRRRQVTAWQHPGLDKDMAGGGPCAQPGPREGHVLPASHLAPQLLAPPQGEALLPTRQHPPQKSLPRQAMGGLGPASPSAKLGREPVASAHLGPEAAGSVASPAGPPQPAACRPTRPRPGTGAVHERQVTCRGPGAKPWTATPVPATSLPGIRGTEVARPWKLTPPRQPPAPEQPASSHCPCACCPGPPECHSLGNRVTCPWAGNLERRDGGWVGRVGGSRSLETGQALCPGAGRRATPPGLGPQRQGTEAEGTVAPEARAAGEGQSAQPYSAISGEELTGQGQGRGTGDQGVRPDGSWGSGASAPTSSLGPAARKGRPGRQEPGQTFPVPVSRLCRRECHRELCHPLVPQLAPPPVPQDQGGMGTLTLRDMPPWPRGPMAMVGLGGRPAHCWGQPPGLLGSLATPTWATGPQLPEP